MLKEITDKRATAQVEAACTDNGGEWNSDTLECKGLSKDWCQKIPVNLKITFANSNPPLN